MCDRYSTEAQRRDLKLRSRDLIRANGGLEAASDFTRLRRSALSDAQSRDRADTFLAADVVLDLELRSGEPLVTRACAQAQGYMLIAAEPLDGAAMRDIVAAAIRSERAGAERSAAVLAAVSDGALTEDEIEALIAASDAALRAERKLNDGLRALRDGPSPRGVPGRAGGP